MFTTQHYVSMARVIRDRRPLSARALQRTGPIEIRNVAIDAANDTLDVIARDLADMLADDNPRFDRAVFLKACKVWTARNGRRAEWHYGSPFEAARVAARLRRGWRTDARVREGLACRRRNREET